MFGGNVVEMPSPEGPVGVARDLEMLELALSDDEDFDKQGMFESFAESPADAAKKDFKDAFPGTDPEMMYQIEAWRRFTALRRLEVPVEVDDLVPTAEQIIFVENSVKKIIGEFLAYIRYATERKEDGYR